MSDDDVKRVHSRYLFNLHAGWGPTSVSQSVYHSFHLVSSPLPGVADLENDVDMERAAAGFAAWSLAQGLRGHSGPRSVSYQRHPPPHWPVRCTGAVTDKCLADLANLLHRGNFQCELWKRLELIVCISAFLSVVQFRSVQLTSLCLRHRILVTWSYRDIQ